MYFSKFLMRKFKGSDYQAIRDLPCHQTRQVFQSQEVQGCLDLPWRRPTQAGLACPGVRPNRSIPSLQVGHLVQGFQGVPVKLNHDCLQHYFDAVTIK